MGQEVSISLQAVKTKVYKLIDALIEGAKTDETRRRRIARSVEILREGHLR